MSKLKIIIFLGLLSILGIFFTEKVFAGCDDLDCNISSIWTTCHDAINPPITGCEETGYGFYAWTGVDSTNNCEPVDCSSGNCVEYAHQTFSAECETCCEASGGGCGDGSCNNGETCATCPADCGSCCGNGACDYGETCLTCPADCGGNCGACIPCNCVGTVADAGTGTVAGATTCGGNLIANAQESTESSEIITPEIVSEKEQEVESVWEKIGGFFGDIFKNVKNWVTGVFS